MKKPSLRFRQVFEHPTHFKVKSPMGNPITIAKSAISPSMQARLRKYAGGTPREPVAPPTLEEAQVARSWQDIMALPQAEQPAAIRTEMDRRRVEQAAPILADVSTPEALDAIQTQRAAENAAASGLPLPADMTPAAAPPAVVPVPVAVPVAEPVAELAAPHRYRPFEASAAPHRVRPFEAPESIALKPVAEPVVATAEPAAPAEVPAVVTVAPKPTAELTVEERIRADTAKALADKQAEIDAAQRVAAEQAIEAGRQAEQYQLEHNRWLAKAEASRGIQEQASNDLAAFKNQGSYLSRLSTMSQIGTALSLAAGAFATGMTGMPNFALQIYNNAVEKDLEKQREDRNSLWNRFVQAGNSAEHADQYVRASMDKAVAARAAQQAALTKNATAAQGLAAFSADMNRKSEDAIAKIKKEAALEAKARAETKIAEAQPAREAMKDLRDEIRRLEELDRQNRLDKNAQEDLNIKRRRLKLDEDEAKRKAQLEQPLPAGATEYDELMNSFKAEGAKGAAKRLQQTVKVDGISLLTTDPQTKQKQQEYWNGVSQTVGTLDRLIKKVESLPAGVALTPAQKADVDALSGAFAVAYPKLEGFRRALSVADKDVVLSKIVKDPGSITSGVLGTSLASLKSLKQAIDEDKYEQLKNMAVEGDPNLAKFAGVGELPLTASSGAQRR